jgi:cyclase
MNSSKNIRIISRLDIKNGFVIKGIQMEGLRKLGDPKEFATNYFNNGIDEILIIDTVASLYQRELLHNVINEITNKIFCPITVGGGIRSIDDARNLFKHGADKIAVNSILFKNQNLLKQLVSEFGSEAIVLSIEAKKIKDRYHAYFNSGRDDSNFELNEWIKLCLESKPGQLLLTSVDNDGTQKGLDLSLLNYINFLNIPIIISGGFGKLDDLETILKFDAVNAIAVGKSFHSGMIRIPEVKMKIFNLGYDVRLSN